MVNHRHRHRHLHLTPIPSLFPNANPNTATSSSTTTSLSRLTLSQPPIFNDTNSLLSLLNLSVQYSDADLAKYVHARSLKFPEDSPFANALMGLYGKFNGGLGFVFELFDEMPQRDLALWNSAVRDVITWTEMITAYMKFGLVELAVEVFDKMPEKNCVSYDALMAGFCRNGEGVLNSINSMYAKCGNMNIAIKVFNIMPIHDLVSWNALIAGHILHRQVDEALAVWSEMEEAGIKPDIITFILVILAYRHTNLDLVDYCRRTQGFLEEAEEIIDKMIVEPKASVWRALLDNCRIDFNTTIGRQSTYLQ
ncbi:hypothetical protein REPUB_Repub02eG0231400 [Reevesia pubescens]